MDFKTDFEKNLNENMQQDDGQPGRAPPEAEDADMELKKKGYPPAPDFNNDEKKAGHPPRFSTLFGTASAPLPPPPPASPPREYVRTYSPEPRRKSGVFIPMPLFIIFAIILFFESTILFAYTVIGLYNNAPTRHFPWAGAGTTTIATTVCDKQPSIINAPNFIVPGQQGPGLPADVETKFITITPTPSTTSSTSSTTTTSSVNTAAAITDLAGLLGSLGTTTSSSRSKSVAVVTVAPERSTATSVKLITEDASGNVVSAQPTPTITQTTFVDPPAKTGA